MVSKRRNMFYENKKRETTEIDEAIPLKGFCYYGWTPGGALITAAAESPAVLLCGRLWGFENGVYGGSCLRCYQCGQYTDGVGSITPCINYTARVHLKECPQALSQHCIEFVSIVLLPTWWSRCPEVATMLEEAEDNKLSVFDQEVSPSIAIVLVVHCGTSGPLKKNNTDVKTYPGFVSSDNGLKESVPTNSVAVFIFLKLLEVPMGDLEGLISTI
ncbi:hypothetical protein AAG570_009761 [Ranatra chinensis]|uniref:Uncharacterized protein n=1 Tax=Ranatra chinensis TaxID=642074 RepID=A0ABD0YQM3_9HEMI